MVSTDFINECKNRANKNRLGQLIVDGNDTPITQSDKLQNFTIDSGCYVDGNIIGSIYIKKIIGNILDSNNLNLLDKIIYAEIGVKYADNSTEYIEMGKYTVERPKDEQTANLSQITGYNDLNNKLENNYACGIDYSLSNVTLSDLYIDVCNQLGLTPVTTTFDNSTITIESNPFTNNEKNRTVLQTIAKIAGAWVEIDDETNQISLNWLSKNEEPDYIFYKNDYATLEGGKIVCGPINCLIIKNSSIDDENVTIKDEESIALNGENSIVINEDYILYNAQLRQQAINSIWNKVHNMTYVDSKLITYYGKPFLKLGQKIRIYTSDTEYFDTYVLKHKFTFDGTFTSIIESPALTKQEIATKQNISLGEFLSNTQVEINKQKQEINLLSNKVINSTETKKGLGSVTINSKLDNPGYKFIVKNACQLFPSKNLFPSTTLFPLGRWLRVTYEDGTYNRYKLPILALRQLNNVYDELIITSGKVQITKRIGMNEDESLYLLDIPIMTDYEDINIVLKRGTNKIQLESFPNANLELQYMIESIYSNTFSTKVETSAEIKVATDEINLEVAKKTDKDKVISTINLSPETVTISAEKVNINGVIKAINNDTSTTIDGNKITTGSITAEEVAGDIITTKNFTAQEINADKITSGNIKSSNYVKDTSGTKINLTDGSIDTKNLKIDSDGSVTITDTGDDVGKSNFVIISQKDTEFQRMVEYESTGVYAYYGLPDEYGSHDYGVSLSTVFGTDPSISVFNYKGNNKYEFSSSNLFSDLLVLQARPVGVDNVQTTIEPIGITTPTVTQTSLESQKKNFEKFDNGLDVINNVDIYKYHLKGQADKDKKHIGFVIGDKYNYSKEITSQNNDGVDLYSMVSVAWQSIKELNQKIEQLENKIKELESDK